jgi:uncharacterized protein (DUF952 family)
MMATILHITSRDAWTAAASSGYYRALSLASEGFIHCSTIAQTEETANRFFHGQQGLVLLCIDESRLEAEVKYEPPVGGAVHDPRADSLFPHLYGPLNVSAVVRVVAFPPKPDGSFELPAEIRSNFLPSAAGNANR